MATLGLPDIFVDPPLALPEPPCDPIEVVEINNAIEIIVCRKVSDIHVSGDSGTTTAVVGKKVSDSSFTAKAEKGDESTIAFNTTKVNKSEIVVKGKGSGVVNVNTGRFNNSSINFNKKSADSIRFNNGVEVRNVTVDASRGADTITFKENAIIKGRNEITLGQGKDVLELPASKKGKGKIVVTDLADNDTIKIGDESFSGKDILNGEVDLPKYIQLGSQLEDLEVIFNDIPEVISCP